MQTPTESMLWRGLGVARLTGQGLSRELLAAAVVTLVALPLSLGVALASGVPPALGLISAVIGGLVVGRLSGAPLQVSGPAAGLAVLVYAAVQAHGLAALGAVVLIGGLVQLLGAGLRLGRWLQLVPASVTGGMMAGIGGLILLSQAQVMMDAAPTGGALTDLLALPDRLIQAASGGTAASGEALAVGLTTLLVAIFWERHRPAVLRPVPGSLVGVAAATALVVLGGSTVARVALPETLVPGGLGWLSALREPGVWASGVLLGVVASAEALLSAAAVDELHEGPRADPDRELLAQGVGNVLAGLLGALPVTGVIVRSSANVQAGARTRLPAMVHGLAIGVLVLLLPGLLGLIPTAALAAVLVHIGARLLAPERLLLHARADQLEGVVYGLTALSVVGLGLLEGVLVGLTVAGLGRLVRSHRLDVESALDEDTQEIHVRLRGAATFLTTHTLQSALDDLPAEYPIRLDLDGLHQLDTTAASVLSALQQGRSVSATAAVPSALL